MTVCKFVAILGVLAGLAGWAEGSVTVGGQTVPDGPVVVNITGYDAVSVYSVANGTYTGASTLDGLSQAAPIGAAAGEDHWGIFRVESIQDITQSVTYYNRTTASEEITGIFWGEQDTYLKQTTVSGQPSQEIYGQSMHMAMFRDAARNFSPNAGPAGRTSSAPTYATATDGQLIWSFSSTPGWNAMFPDDEFFMSFRPNAAPGSVNADGGFYARTDNASPWGTGAWNNQVDPNGAAQGAAARFDFTGNPGPYSWNTRTTGPLQLMIITPEPASLLLLLSGAGWMVGRARKRAVRL